MSTSSSHHPFVVVVDPVFLWSWSLNVTYDWLEGDPHTHSIGKPSVHQEYRILSHHDRAARTTNVSHLVQNHNYRRQRYDSIYLLIKRVTISRLHSCLKYISHRSNLHLDFGQSHTHREERHPSSICRNKTCGPTYAHTNSLSQSQYSISTSTQHQWWRKYRFVGCITGLPVLGTYSSEKG